MVLRQKKCVQLELLIFHISILCFHVSSAEKLAIIRILQQRQTGEAQRSFQKGKYI